MPSLSRSKIAIFACPPMVASMKPGLLLVAGSLVANAVLLTMLVLRTGPSSTSAIAGEHDGTSAPAAGDSRIVAVSPPTATAAWQALESEDLASFTSNLRAAGLAEPLVRAIVRATIDEQFRKSEEALVPSRPAPNYWEADDRGMSREMRLATLQRLQADQRHLPLETRLALLDLWREKARLSLAVLGPDPSEPAHDRRLPADKRELAQIITEDYDTAIRDIRQRGGQMLLPEEQAMLKTLKEQKENELAAVLTPDEVAEYKMRSSWTMHSLRQELGPFAPTEDEFRSIYAVREELQTRQNEGPGKRRDDFPSHEEFVAYMNGREIERKELEQTLEDRLRQELGEERYRAYERETNPHLREIRALVDRASLSPEIADRVFDLRANAEEASARIGDDTSVSVADRQAALRRLAENTRTEAQSLLGLAAADAYLQAANSWLRQLERGHKIVFKGNGYTASPISPAPPPVGP